MYVYPCVQLYACTGTRPPAVRERDPRAVWQLHAELELEVSQVWVISHHICGAVLLLQYYLLASFYLLLGSSEY